MDVPPTITLIVEYPSESSIPGPRNSTKVSWNYEVEHTAAKRHKEQNQSVNYFVV